MEGASLVLSVAGGRTATALSTGDFKTRACGLMATGLTSTGEGGTRDEGVWLLLTYSSRIHVECANCRMLKKRS